MAIGDPGEAGPSVPRIVMEEPRIARDAVILPRRHMVEILAVGNLQSPKPATPVNAS